MTNTLRSEDERPARLTRVLAKFLTRRYRWKLYGATAILTAAGFLHGLLVDSPTAFPRYGALIALVTFWHALAQQKYLSMLQHDIEPFGRTFGRRSGGTLFAQMRTCNACERRFKRSSAPTTLSAARSALLCGALAISYFSPSSPQPLEVCNAAFPRSRRSPRPLCP